MFQYTREIIINPGKDIKLLKNATSGNIEGLFIDHVMTYVPSRIKDIVKVPYAAPVLEKKTIEFATNTTNDTRLNLRVFLHGDVEASYANSFTWFNKPFIVEFPKGTTLAEAVALINQSIKASDHPFVKVTAGTGVIEIAATDCYQEIKDLKIEKFVPRSASFHYEGEWVDLGKTVDDVADRKEGHGTPFQLMKNHRLPTMDNLRFMGENQEELPISNLQYTLYEIKYDSGLRNIGGSSAVGEKSVSHTTHRLWVANGITGDVDGTATEFDTIITSLKTASAAPTYLTVAEADAKYAAKTGGSN